MIENRAPRRLSTAMNATVVGTGQGSTVVLAHGFGTDQSLWDKMLPYLAQYRQVLTFDWLFSGAAKAVDEDGLSLFEPEKYSSYEPFANDLVDLLDELGLKSVLFVGHSMSAMIGSIASIKRPELFKNLVFIGASPRYINAEDYEGGFEKSNVDQIMSNIESNYYNWTSHFASLVVDSADPLSVEMFEKCLMRMLPHVALPLAKVVFYCDERDTLEKVTVPCTIIQTASDVVVPTTVGFYMQRKMIKAKSTVEIIGSATGHFPMLTAHLELLDVLGVVLGFYTS